MHKKVLFLELGVGRMTPMFIQEPLGRVDFTISFFITDAVLAATLKDLFEDGIIDRKSYAEIPPPR